MSRLCVETHLRGHVASCNGRIELVKARVEPHSSRDYGNFREAQELQARAEEAQRQKEERLLNFQRAVKVRVQRRERARQKQLSEAESKFKSKRPCPVIRRKVLHKSSRVVTVVISGNYREEVQLSVREKR